MKKFYILEKLSNQLNKKLLKLNCKKAFIGLTKEKEKDKEEKDNSKNNQEIYSTSTKHKYQNNKNL